MTGHNPKHRLIVFRGKCHTAFTVRYEPGNACQIIMACIVLHNIAVKLKLPVPDEDKGKYDNGHGFEQTTTTVMGLSKQLQRSWV